MILAEETLDLSEASQSLMRFVCDSCRAQYMISDDKVGPNGVKVRCKKCGHVIVVRRPRRRGGWRRGRTPGARSRGRPRLQRTPTAENYIFSGVDDDEIGAAFDQRAEGRGRTSPTPSSRRRTRTPPASWTRSR